MVEMMRPMCVAVAIAVALVPASAASQADADGSTVTPIIPRAAMSDPIDQWAPMLDEASRKFGIPVAWIRAVMRVESDGQTMLNGAPITSPAGAMGLMQVMPDTYAEMQICYGLGADPYDPRDNILAGTAYLREMYQRYGYPDLFAAYNAGPARFDEFLYNGASLPPETTAYLEKLGHLELAEAAWPARAADDVKNGLNEHPRSLPAEIAASPGTSGIEGFTPSSQGLFVSLPATQDHVR
jgi:soluble lytic murein transglycosylase-like protein